MSSEKPVVSTHHVIYLFRQEYEEYDYRGTAESDFIPEGDWEKLYIVTSNIANKSEVELLELFSSTTADTPLGTCLILAMCDYWAYREPEERDPLVMIWLEAHCPEAADDLKNDEYLIKYQLI